MSESTVERPDIRLSQLKAFLKKAERSSQCPFCPHKGAWAMHLHTTDDPVADKDPLVYVYGSGEWSYVAMSCPQCGHLSQISLFVIENKHKGAQLHG